MSAVLDVRDLSLAFGRVVPFDGVSFSVEEGEIFAIIGPNGAGKTSLFNTLSRVYQPHQGALELRGKDMLRFHARDLAHEGVARTFQNLSLFGHMTVLQNVMVGRHHLMRGGTLATAVWFGRTRNEERVHLTRAMEALAVLGLDAVAQAPVSALSYGQQKRAELARAIAMEPSLLLLDEPLAGVAHAERIELARVIRDAHLSRGLTTLLVEHDMNMVMAHADRVMVLDFGKVIAIGTPAEIQNNPEVIRAYLGETA